LPPADRWCWMQKRCLQRGHSLALTVNRNGRRITATLLVQSSHLGTSLSFRMGWWSYYISIISSFWLLAFASIIGWRRSESSEAHVLALLLVLTSASVPLANWTYGPVTSVTLYVVGSLCGSIGTALLATYAMLFKPASRARTLLAWSSYVLALLSVFQQCAWVYAVWTLAIDPNGPLFSGWVADTVTGILPLLLPVFCGALAIAETRGAERARLSWAIASLGVFYLIEAASAPVDIIGYNIALIMGNSGTLVAPLGLTYGLLNRKLLDVGFALNRTAVFTAVSFVMVGLFILLEWAFGEWLKDASHVANVAISGGLALVLGLSIRFVHDRVEHIVDNLFFRKRHENEAALRAFAHEAGYINNAETLVSRTVAEIELHAGAAGVQLALDDRRGHYGDVSEDDPAIVALRARHRALDLDDFETALRGEMAFPMVARGRLVGALVLGPKRSGETYAPDESDAIMQIAQNVGTSLAVLDRKPALDGDPLEEIRALRDDIRSLQGQMAALACALVPDSSMASPL
jgi:hypothetical protein